MRRRKFSAGMRISPRSGGIKIERGLLAVHRPLLWHLYRQTHLARSELLEDSQTYEHISRSIFPVSARPVSVCQLPTFSDVTPVQARKGYT